MHTHTPIRDDLETEAVCAVSETVLGLESCTEGIFITPKHRQEPDLFFSALPDVNFNKKNRHLPCITSKLGQASKMTSKYCVTTQKYSQSKRYLIYKN